jgi:hypothetical protein
MTEQMKRKEYKKPTTKVVILQQKSHILSYSQPQGEGVEDYVWNSYEEE